MSAAHRWSCKLRMQKERSFESRSMCAWLFFGSAFAAAPIMSGTPARQLFLASTGKVVERCKEHRSYAILETDTAVLHCKVAHSRP